MTKEAKTDTEKEAEAKIEQKFEAIVKKGECQEPLKLETEQVAKSIRGLKRKKAADVDSWRNEMIIDGKKWKHRLRKWQIKS